MQLFRDNGFRTLTWIYFSAFFCGALATVASYLVGKALFFANGNGLDNKLYKLKTTFLRRFLIIGSRQND
jgi:hypothetical protein